MNIQQKYGLVVALKGRLIEIERELRADLDAQMPVDGGRLNIAFGGHVVGSAIKTAPTIHEQREVVSVKKADTAAFKAWLGGVGREAIDGWVVDNAERFAGDYFDSTGEIPDGIQIEATLEPEWVKPGYITYRGCKFNDVDAALDGLQPAITALLEESND